jgi:hypothetical protein
MRHLENILPTAKRDNIGLTLSREVIYNPRHAIVLALLPELQGESCA